MCSMNKQSEAQYQAAKGNLERSPIRSEDLKWGNEAIALGFDHPGYLRLQEEFGTKEREKLKEVFHKIRSIIHSYMDIPEQHSLLIALWIIGTYWHKQFESYPFLFINAMRGSGKTRLCKIIQNLAWNGTLTNNISEAVLFRTASNHTIIIDECEQIGNKEKNTLRELLQGAYKKGSNVKRMKKKGEEQVVEEFLLYTPVAIANIWGMEGVLGDRCIPIILEKSVDLHKTTLIEDFAENEHFRGCTAILENKSVELCIVYSPEKVKQKWNNYISSLYTTTYTTPLYTTIHNTTQQLNNEEKELFDKIRNTGINGRHLELFFPLFIIAKSVGDDVLDQILSLAKEKVSERKEDEYAESRDVTFIDFVAQQKEGLDFRSVNELTVEFRNFSNHERSDEWLNSQWVGKALKRLQLVLSKKRSSKGMQVMLNIPKAKERIKMFKEEE